MARKVAQFERFPPIPSQTRKLRLSCCNSSDDSDSKPNPDSDLIKTSEPNSDESSQTNRLRRTSTQKANMSMNVQLHEGVVPYLVSPYESFIFLIHRVKLIVESGKCVCAVVQQPVGCLFLLVGSFISDLLSAWWRGVADIPARAAASSATRVGATCRSTEPCTCRTRQCTLLTSLSRCRSTRSATGTSMSACSVRLWFRSRVRSIADGEWDAATFRSAVLARTCQSRSWRRTRRDWQVFARLPGEVLPMTC